jgi:antitoxin MazE
MPGDIRMLTRIQKWGNSLAVRIPKPFAIEAGLEQDTQVEMSLVDGKLILTPITESALTLELLLARVTEQNLHREVDTGPATGNEVV